MLRAVIFDMDDVILSSSPFDFPSWSRVFEAFGRRLTVEEYNGFLGMRNPEILGRFFPKLSEEERNEWAMRKESFFLELLHERKATMTPHLETLLRELNGQVKLAVATSAPKMKLDGILQYLHLRKYFPVIVHAEMVSRGKPQPEMFLLAAIKLGVKPAECLVVEDAVNGVEAAKAAGMKCLAITTTHTKTELKDADLLIDSFDEIDMARLRRMFARRAAASPRRQ